MRSWDFSRRAFSIGAVFAISACGGLRQAQGDMPPVGAPGAVNRNATAAAPLARIEDRGLESPCVGSACGLTPADLQAHYKLPSGTNGKGQIVAIVDAYNNPRAASDLNAYRTEFGLGTAAFRKYNQDGDRHKPPPVCGLSAEWCVEEDVDTEMVSAVCPNCKIYLIEANSSSFSDLKKAELEAVRLGAHIVTNSWTCYDLVVCTPGKAFSKPGVTYLASAGDTGSNELGAPAAFDTVAAIGGTILKKQGSQYTESVGDGARGGCATGIKKPRWQHDKTCPGRLTNDAAAAGGGVAIYSRYSRGWTSAGGTGVAAPILAGVFALAGNATQQDGGRTFWLRAHRKYLYDLPGQCAYRQGQYTTCDGWGSPNGVGAF